MPVLPNPVLVWFLLSRRKNHDVEHLAELSRDLPGVPGGYAPSTIDRWFRSPTRMTAASASDLLRLMELEEEWRAFNHARSVPPPISGVLDYHSSAEGLFVEADFEACRRRGLSAADIAAQLVEIDSQLFADTPSVGWVGSAANWTKITEVYPEFFRVFLTADGRIAAYWMFVTPPRDLFEAGCLGDYPEHKIALETLAAPGERVIEMFGPGMYVAPRYSQNLQSVLGSRLLISFTYQLHRLRDLGIDVRRICVPVFSQQGRRLVEERFGLERMPPNINKRYGAQLGWSQSGVDGHQYPELYFSWVTDELLARAGLASVESASPASKPAGQT